MSDHPATPTTEAWSQDRLRREVDFCLSPARRLRREDREIAFALEIERLRARVDELEREKDESYQQGLADGWERGYEDARE